MDGIGGQPGWAWIFILEGLFTVILACVSPWVLQDFPESATFLSEAERMFTTPTLHMSVIMLMADIYIGVHIIRELKEDMRFSADEEKFELKYLRQCLTDWKTYVTRGSPSPQLRSVIVMTYDLIRSWNVYGNVGVIPYR